MKRPTWIWYFGDFEIRQHLKLDIQRLEENLYRPAPWKLDDCWHNVVFKKSIDLDAPAAFRVTIDGVGSVRIHNEEYAKAGKLYFSAGEWLTAPAGHSDIVVEAANLTDLPSIFVESRTVGSETAEPDAPGSDDIISDDSWFCAYDNYHFEPVGCWNFDDITVPPSRFSIPASPIELKPLPCEEGLLFDAGKETMARLHLVTKGTGNVCIFYGESLTEALDNMPNMWIRVPAQGEWTEPARAFRYVRLVPDADVVIQNAEALYEHLPLQRRGSFHCSDPKMDQIFDVSAYTLELNARECFLDGIKRDRYAWSGDAYQSYLLNYYLFFDNDICQRTTLALRGKDPMGRHINTIMDYSFYWVLGLADYYRYTGDLDFIRRIWPKAVSLMNFCLERRGKKGPSKGLMIGLPEDWVFMDWAPLDKDGPICAEQILLAASLETMADLGKALGKADASLEQDGSSVHGTAFVQDTSSYLSLAAELRSRIQELYWDEDQGAFIDSFTSGKKLVTRQTNLFAIRFGLADERQKELIIHNVLFNDEVTAITTPYFKFYEMESLCSLGHQKAVTDRIKEYWGGMLDLGATSFWEEFDPQNELKQEECYSMYGKAYGRSLCHAWGASPIYLLGRFYLGVRPTAPGYTSYVVEPKLGGLSWMEGTVPTPQGDIHVTVRDGQVKVVADLKEGMTGLLRFGGKEVSIIPGEEAVLDL